MHEVGDSGCGSHIRDIWFTSEEAGNAKTMAFDIKNCFTSLAIEGTAFDFGVTVVVGTIGGGTLFAFEFREFEEITIVAI